ncbi:hypothetical protein AX16_001122 [Volvariella volvacea WC 439]|nr:hypothetical protein AX16_001122 [Volvariella volvacea WC 439]
MSTRLIPLWQLLLHHHTRILSIIQPPNQRRLLHRSAPHIKRPRRERAKLVLVQPHRLLDVLRYALCERAQVGLEERRGGLVREREGVGHFAAIALATAVPVAYGCEADRVWSWGGDEAFEFFDELYGGLVYFGDSTAFAIAIAGGAVAVAAGATFAAPYVIRCWEAAFEIGGPRAKAFK